MIALIGLVIVAGILGLVVLLATCRLEDKPVARPGDDGQWAELGDALRRLHKHRDHIGRRQTGPRHARGEGTRDA